MKKGFIEEFVAIFFFGFLMLAVTLTVFGVRFSNQGLGNHSGFVTAVDQTGYIFLNYDVYFKTDNSSSQEDTYCVDRHNKPLIDQLKKYNLDRTLVQIEYKGVRGIGFGLCSGEEILSVKELK